MASTHRFISLVTALLLTVGLVAGCSTTPDSADDEQRLDETSAEDFLQTEDVLVAGKIAPDRLSELTPLLQRLAQTIDEPEAREFADISPDPIGHLEAMHDMPNDLSALAQDRPTYILMSHRGNLDFLQSARLGLPTQTEEWPAYFNVRLLLPTADTEALAEQLGPWVDELRDNADFGAAELYDGPGFVRLELAVDNRGHSAPDGVDAQQWLASLNLQNLRPPATADYRPTPAYDAFVDSEAPFGIWAPVESLSRLGAFELVEFFAAEHGQIGPAGQPQHFLEGVSRIAAASVVDDPVSAEVEDLSILFSTHDDGALLIDTYATRTELGARIDEAMAGSVSLPGFATDDPFINIIAQADMQAVAETAEFPFWSSFDDWNDDMIDTGIQPPQTADQSPLPFSDDPAGFPLMAIAAQYPWTAFATTSDAFDDLLPLPRALALESFVPDPRTGLPVGGALAAAFADNAENRMAIEQLLGMADGMMGGRFDAELFGRDDGLLEVHIALGAELQDIFGQSPQSREIDTAEVSLDLSAVQGLARMLPGSEAVELFDKLHLRTHGDDTYQTMRISVGTDEAVAAEPVEARVQPLAMPSQRCRTEIAAASIEYLSDLRADATGHVDRWAQAVNERAAQCLDAQHPAASLIEERIELAREIADDIP